MLAVEQQWNTDTQKLIHADWKQEIVQNKSQTNQKMFNKHESLLVEFQYRLLKFGSVLDQFGLALFRGLGKKTLRRMSFKVFILTPFKEAEPLTLFKGLKHLVTYSMLNT